VYTPDFAGGDYREAVADESDGHVTFEFTTPYIIAATPAGDDDWGVYQKGCRNGLVLRGKASCPVSVSVDRGRTWKEAGAFSDGLDLTDAVKGHRQYLLKLGAGAKALAASGLTVTTVCQASVSVIPRLKDGGTRVTFESSGRAVLSAGPNLDQARAHLVEGDFGTPSLVLELPRKEGAAEVYAAAHALSYTEPNPRITYQIDQSADGGKTWTPVVKDWRVVRLGEGPKSGWSQSFVWGSAQAAGAPLRVRFSNSGNIQFRRAEAHLVYRTPGKDATRVTFDWTEDAGARRESRVFPAGAPAPWDLKTGTNVVTRWVEYEAVRAP
ncbi:MAG TPA: hypothetical protein VEJ18_03760, partial [Planctomycetota bacterium]|nr:hypothetical protein [Planctomycetota bacterium]